MQSLLGGADCSTSSNPLKQIAQREGVDNSLFRDRLAGPSGPPGHQAFRSSPARPNPVQAHVNATPHPFNLSHLSAALSEPNAAIAPYRPGHIQPPPSTAHFDGRWGAAQQQNHHVQAQQAHQVRINGSSSRSSPAPFAQEFTNGRQAGRSDWAQGFQQNEMMGKGKGRAADPVQAYAQFQSTMQPQSGMGMNGMSMGMGGMGGMGMGMGMGGMSYQSQLQPMYGGYQQQGPQQGQVMQGRSEQEQADMEAAFEKALEDARFEDKGKQAQQPVEEVDDGIEDRGEAKGEFDKVWESLKPEAERLNKLAEWESEFSQFVNGEDDLYDTLNESLNQPNVGQTSLNDQMRDMYEAQPAPEAQLQADGLPRRHEYEFAQFNKFDTMDAQQAWAEANHLLSSGGSLTDASLLIESYVRRATTEHFAQPGQSEVEAWSLLGQTHAMDEKEEKALSAFEEGREVLKTMQSPPAVGEMLTNLAISYVNESFDLAALQVLHQYLTISHPAQAGPLPSQDRMLDAMNPWKTHQEMTDMFLAVARAQFSNQGQVDADLQVGLGTLYYMMGQYDEARDCWVAALGERPTDYLLWNRLGATLANSGNPEEAVDAYRRALELRPTFTRAIFNLGVACLNIGVHREAAEHFLAALSLHSRNSEAGSADGLNDSSSIWSTLKRSLVALDMLDLAEHAKPGTDLNVFRSAGFDF